MLRVRGGKVSHVGYCGPRHTDILEFLPNGDLMPAPDIPGMQRAWADFSAASRASTNQALEDVAPSASDAARFLEQRHSRYRPGSHQKLVCTPSWCWKRLAARLQFSAL